MSPESREGRQKILHKEMTIGKPSYYAPQSQISVQANPNMNNPYFDPIQQKRGRTNNII